MEFVNATKDLLVGTVNVTHQAFQVFSWTIDVASINYMYFLHYFPTCILYYHTNAFGENIYIIIKTIKFYSFRDNDSEICSGRGHCSCGTCICDKRDVNFL